uniref:Ubiquinol-cytochrome-c reductase complex assembly factor 3 n=1 Tax=Neolamprologus brichardi TaxID=32507 RepID=A0A3Q4GML6_NEOBR
MSGMRTMLASAIMVGALGVGYGMWSVISPGEERRREMIKVIHKRLLYSRRRCALTLQEFAVRTPSEEEEDARPRKHSRVGKIG